MNELRLQSESKIVCVHFKMSRISHVGLTMMQYPGPIWARETKKVAYMAPITVSHNNALYRLSINILVDHDKKSMRNMYPSPYTSKLVDVIQKVGQ